MNPVGVTLLKLMSCFEENGSVAQLNRASDYGSEGYRFESCRSHKGSRKAICEILFFVPVLYGFLFFHRIEVGDHAVKLRGECKSTRVNNRERARK